MRLIVPTLMVVVDPQGVDGLRCGEAHVEGVPVHAPLLEAFLNALQVKVHAQVRLIVRVGEIRCFEAELGLFLGV